VENRPPNIELYPSIWLNKSPSSSSLLNLISWGQQLPCTWELRKLIGVPLWIHASFLWMVLVCFFDTIKGIFKLTFTSILIKKKEPTLLIIRLFIFRNLQEGFFFLKKKENLREVLLNFYVIIILSSYDNTIYLHNSLKNK